MIQLNNEYGKHEIVTKVPLDLMDTVSTTSPVSMVGLTFSTTM